MCSKLARCIRRFVFCGSKCKLFRAQLLAGAPALPSALISCICVPLFGSFVPQQVSARLFRGSWRYLIRFFVLKTPLPARLQNFRRCSFVFPEALRSFAGLFPRFFRLFFRFRMRFFWRFLRFLRFFAGSSSAVRLFFLASAVFLPPKLTALALAVISSRFFCPLLRARLLAGPALMFRPRFCSSRAVFCSFFRQNSRRAFPL